MRLCAVSVLSILAIAAGRSVAGAANLTLSESVPDGFIAGPDVLAAGGDTVSHDLTVTVPLLSPSQGTLTSVRVIGDLNFLGQFSGGAGGNGFSSSYGGPLNINGVNFGGGGNGSGGSYGSNGQGSTSFAIETDTTITDPAILSQFAGNGTAALTLNGSVFLSGDVGSTASLSTDLSTYIINEVYTPAPEPSSVALVGLAAGGLLRRRRRA